MPERISLRHDYDNESVDPAAGSVSSESQHENPSVSAASTTSRNNNVNHNNEVDRRSTNTTRHSSTSTTTVTAEIERRISELRAILPGECYLHNINHQSVLLHFVYAHMHLYSAIFRCI